MKNDINLYSVVILFSSKERSELSYQQEIQEGKSEQEAINKSIINLINDIPDAKIKKDGALQLYKHWFSNLESPGTSFPK